mmetsp:Transcript_4766/g.5207  ORF Transcript_4766/g.5207 Transcript_4766/m.5207 type:complete len:119 (+) Transcript_4766:36-392(+)
MSDFTNKVANGMEEEVDTDSVSELDEEDEEIYNDLIKGLKKPGEDAYMEDYLKDNRPPETMDNQYFNIKVIKQRPEDYFNFGFRYADYEAFFAKQILMRVEKGIIKDTLFKGRPEAPK